MRYPEAWFIDDKNPEIMTKISLDITQLIMHSILSSSCHGCCERAQCSSGRYKNCYLPEESSQAAAGRPGAHILDLGHSTRTRPLR